MIELRQLTKRYGATTAVDALSVTVESGKVTGFLGPNGAGKSTTMRMVLGLDHPSAGSALIGGRRYRDLRDPLREVGALLEAKAVHPARSARNHLRWLARTNRIPLSRVDEVLGRVGLDGVGGDRAGGFSLGMGQRLGLAVALLGDPAVLLLDEPVNGLDPEGVRWMRTLVRALAEEGRTVFVSSHLMGEMAITADHLVVIGRGRLLADTGMADFIAANSRSVVLVRTRDVVRLATVLHQAGMTVARGEDGALSVSGATAAEVGALATAHGVVLDELGTRTASLEEAFLELTADAAQYRAEVA